ncbi:hypothetical protein QQ045_016086 [Rhodiola kirilowii]
MKKFRDVMQDCNLSDIGFKGAQFAFSNKRKGIWQTRARLDRAIANDEWRQRFPKAEVWHGVSGCSDHAPLIIRWIMHRKYSRKRLFRFEPMWLRHRDFGDFIKDAWEANAGNTQNLTNCLQSCAGDLKKWNDQHYGDVNRKIKHLQMELSKVQEEERTGVSIEKELQISRDLDEWFLREELFWKQRSRVDWL